MRMSIHSSKYTVPAHVCTHVYAQVYAHFCTTLNARLYAHVGTPHLDMYMHMMFYVHDSMHSYTHVHALAFVCLMHVHKHAYEHVKYIDTNVH